MSDSKQNEEIPVEAQRIRGPRGFESVGYIKKQKKFFKTLKREVNVAVFGPFGAGKSALITTWATALSRKKRILKGIAPSRANGDHVTKELSKIETEMKVNLLDCWGYSDDNFKPSTVERIMDGYIKPGTNMFDTSAGKKGKGQETAGDTIDAVVLVVDAQDILGFESVLNKLNELIALLLDRQMTPFIALNKIDTVDPDTLRDDLGSVFKSNKVKSRIFAVHQETGLSVNQIFPVKSYSTEWDREEDVEKLALLCLQEAIQSNVDESAFEEEEETSDFEYDN
jgi:ribosome biogenesis GTPase A